MNQTVASAEGYTTPDGRQIGGTMMDIRNIVLRFGDVTAIKDVSFDIFEKRVTKARYSTTRRTRRFAWVRWTRTKRSTLLNSLS